MVGGNKGGEIEGVLSFLVRGSEFIVVPYVGNYRSRFVGTRCESAAFWTPFRDV